MHFSACVPAIFGSRSVSDALPAVAAAGLEYYEFWGWWDLNLAALERAQRERGLKPAALCTRFISLTDPSLRKAYLEGLKETVAVCRRLGCPVIISQVGQELPNTGREAQHSSILQGLKAAIPLLEGEGITLCFEPLNTKIDHPGYYLWSSREAFEIADELASPRVKVLYDLYHQHIMEGTDEAHIIKNLDKIAHFHMAGHPGRHEPLDPNEIDYLPLLRHIEQAGYTGAVGLEYMPLRNGAQGLKETAEKLQSVLRR